MSPAVFLSEGILSNRVSELLPGKGSPAESYISRRPFLQRANPVAPRLPEQ